jgi:prolyl-tRNA editing enzyme YbaK/EbsC (Cys-tRNA(Pro) deacylase)
MTSSSTQKVQEKLQALGFPCEILELSESTRTAPDAARAIGCNLGQIVKSLIFKGQSTGKPILALKGGRDQRSRKASFVSHRLSCRLRCRFRRSLQKSGNNAG